MSGRERRLDRLVYVLLVVVLLAAFSFPVHSVGGRFSRTKTQANNASATSSATVNTRYGYVSSTLVVSNGSLVPGSYMNPLNGNGPDGATYDPVNGYVYIAAAGTSNILILNGSTDAFAASIPVGSFPYAVVYDNFNGFLYVSNYFSNNVTIINATTSKVVANVYVGVHPAQISFSSDLVFVANYNSANITLINATTNSVKTTYSVAYSYTNAVVYDPANGEIYVGGEGSAGGDISVLNATTGSTVTTISTGSYPLWEAYDPSNGYIYVANSGTGFTSVSVINGATNLALTSVRVGSPQNGAIYDTLNGYVYVSGYSANEVYVIDGTSDTLVTSIQVGSGPYPGAVDSANGNIIVPDGEDNSIAVIDGSTNTLLTMLTAGSNPYGVAFDPANGSLYVAGFGRDVVFAINATTKAIVATVRAGSGPEGIVYDPSNGYIYASNVGSNNVSVIDGGTNKVIDSINTGLYPSSLLYDPSNGYIYTANTDSLNVTVIDGQSNTVIGTITPGGSNQDPYGLAYNSQLNYVYLSHFDPTSTAAGSVSIISNTTIVKTVTVGSDPQGMAYDSSNGYTYVANTGSNSVSILNGATLITNVNVGGAPAGAFYDVASDTIFVTNSLTDNVSVIAGSNDTVVNTVAVGYGPVAGIYDYESGTAFVSNFYSGTLSLILFAPEPSPLYSVTFRETGLPAGSSWTVTLGSLVISSSTVVISFEVSNGTYTFLIASKDLTANPQNGTLTVNGANMVESVSLSFYSTVTFHETGLPSGTNWTVVLNGTSRSSTTNTLSFAEVNGSYSYTVQSIGYNATPSSGIVTVSGLNVSLSVIFTPAEAFTITFEESGLQLGTFWNVTLNGVLSTSFVSTVNFSMSNGTYPFSVGQVAGYTVSPSNGNITVSNQNETEVITFTSQSTFSRVNFFVQNLPSGGLYEILVYTNGTYPVLSNNGISGAYYSTGLLNSSAAVVSLPSGAYSYLIWEAPYGIGFGQSGGPPFSFGSYIDYVVPGFDATTSSVSVTVLLPVLYQVTFYDNVLPYGWYWGVVFWSSTWGNPFTNPNPFVPLTILPNSPSYLFVGTTYDSALVAAGPVASYSLYAAEVAPNSNVYIVLSSASGHRVLYNRSSISAETSSISALSVAAQSGSPSTASSSYNSTMQFNITTSPQNITLNFPRVYTVTFFESGLVRGTTWGVSFNGTSETTLNATLTFYSVNGTYPFDTQPISGYTVLTTSGTLTINGANVSQVIDFESNSSSTYSVNFMESGLPAGTQWSVSMAGYVLNSTTTSISFVEGNGSYSYAISGIAGYTVSPSNGTVSVNGGNVRVTVVFIPSHAKAVTFAITFTETGLPKGTVWYVNLSSGQSFAGTGSNTTFMLPNGSYSYTIATANKDYASGGGSFVVNGSTKAITVTFSAVDFTVTFTENGLSTGTSWSVTFNGASRSSSGTSITFSVDNGTYSYEVANLSGYSSSPTSGTLTVSGSTVNNNITFAKQATTPSPSKHGLSMTDYEVIGGVVVVAVIAGVAGVALSRRRKRV